MSRASLPAIQRGTAAAVAVALCLPLAAVPARAEEDGAPESLSKEGLPHSSAEAISRGEVAEETMPQAELTTTFLSLTGARVTNMEDLLGLKTLWMGLGAGDLGAMAPLGDGSSGEFAIVFGDSFSGAKFGEGEWLSPVGVVGKKDRFGRINVVRPLNSGARVKQMVGYLHDDGTTLLPSDIINIDGTLYMQAMWNRPFGNVSSTQVFRSDDDGKTWAKAGRPHYSRIQGFDDLISWEMGPDGYLYAVSTQFSRSKPVYLWRANPEDIADQSKWEIYNTNTRSWGSKGTAILDRNADGSAVKAGEMNLRYIDGYWVLCMFNESAAAVEVRISDTLERDWNDVPAVAIVKNGPWSAKQTPDNWSQPYGGYIVPGSTLNNMDVVISQWKTGDNSRYMSTRFNVTGLRRNASTYNPDAAPQTSKPELDITSRPAATGGGSGSSDSAVTAAIILGVLAGAAGLAALAWPVLRPLLPPQVQAALPF